MQFLLWCLMAIGLGWESPVSAQITPGGSGTVVNQNGQQFNITGGTQAGRNLFHTFHQFGLNQGQVANFFSNPAIANILARVNGGSASYINGLIQVLGGNSNLFLMNPAGIVFGPNASLNVPAAFTATTADRIMFPGGSFNAYGNNDYSKLAGEPIGFAFDRKEPAAIINEGKLTVNPGQSVSLIAGQVINTGTIQAPGGNITIAAVPGENLVRLSQKGQLLSLEFNPQQAASMADAAGNIPVIRLPELLTGGGVTTVTQNTNGTVATAGSNLQIPVSSGTAIVSGTLDVSSENKTGGTIGVFGSKIAVVNGELNASGYSGGGQILVGGEFQGKGSVPNAEYTFISSSSKLLADAVNTGDGGRVIVWADKATQFWGTISARGGQVSGNGGFVEVSGKESLNFQGQVDTFAPQGQAGTLLLDPANIIVSNDFDDDSQLDDNQILFADSPGATFKISTAKLNSQLGTGNVILQATNNITFSVDFSYTGLATSILEIEAGNSISTQGITVASGSRIGLNFKAGNTITISDLVETGRGNVALQANGNITTQGINTSSSFGSAGSVQITSANGSITTGAIEASIPEGNGGNVTLVAAQGIQTGSIDTFGFRGGNVTLTSNQNIQTGSINTSALDDKGGNVTLTAGQNIQTDVIRTLSSEGDGGNVTLTAGKDIKAEYIDARSLFGTTGGIVNISAPQGNVRLTGLFDTCTDCTPTNFDTTIATNNNPITITHGGNGIIPFIVGDANTNGSAGILTTGTSSISPTQSFFPSTVVGNISILTGTNPPPVVPPPPEPPSNPASPPLLPTDNIDEILFGTIPSPIEPDAPGEVILNTVPVDRSTVLALLERDPGQIIILEQSFSNLFGQFLNISPINSFDSIEAIQIALAEIAEKTGTRPAVIYLIVDEEQLGIVVILPGRPQGIASNSGVKVASTQLPIWTAQAPIANAPIFRSVPQAKAANLQATVQAFLNAIKEPRQRATNNYQRAGKQLYDWLIAPIEAELKAQGIDTIMFIPDEGLRTLPLGALWDGQQFLIEKFSLGQLPSINLVDFNYRPVQGANLLAMGASQFKNQEPLKGVPIELETIAKEWGGKALLNEQFTISNLIREREQTGFVLLHLATHAEFRPSTLKDAYIEFWNEQLTLDQVRNLPLRKPPVELLVLSACRTAVGDPYSELGFAGLAVASGVKSALASSWYVSDVGTVALMAELYQQLQKFPTKAQAVRQAQLQMIRGQVRLEGDKIIRTNKTPLPSPEPGFQADLSHPYYWAGFTLIGSPW
ncbi:CHAT domain-containing protein [Gloeomargaritales cyanobacterium VI4D9]|nr:CHAT domain-containing protein [Gloeomargaritales cyanobacterium VI4D9]